MDLLRYIIYYALYLKYTQRELKFRDSTRTTERDRERGHPRLIDKRRYLHLPPNIHTIDEKVEKHQRVEQRYLNTLKIEYIVITSYGNATTVMLPT